MGATTIWERWDGIRPDGTFETPSMNSFNHYAYGSIGDWMYRVIAGIDTYEDGPGYKHIKIMPHPGGGLTHADADLQTYYGKVSSHWNISTSGMNMDVEIPANTHATIYIPASSADSIKESNQPLTNIKELSIKAKEGQYVVVEAGSGYYHFAIEK
jgi:alpha-L-rhamnosidase